MRVLVACEFSGVVRDAFIKTGHDAISCDILPSQAPGPHIQADIKTVDVSGFDLIIAHPPCTHLAVSGARWFEKKQQEQAEAIAFFLWFTRLPVKHICIENPVGIMSSLYRKSDQIIHPWMFGHGEQKKTCLWLKNLPRLKSTKVVPGRAQRIWRLPPSENRWALRSVTYTGIAEAMATQWGSLPEGAMNANGQFFLFEKAG